MSPQRMIQTSSSGKMSTFRNIPARQPTASKVVSMQRAQLRSLMANLGYGYASK